MATIKSDRDAAKAFNGQKAKFLRNVEPPDPAFEKGGEAQVVVEIDGREVYFLASEVTLDADEKPAKAKSAAKPAPSGEEK